ncbi:amidase domain-containing protein [Aneurinibacillus sp. Ricciae_BoGa-3]|uniref:amidase domain-containing protein n=1 Tax=Aneurinibacillus sp. Ricciae_BoGa-3 TaxID=3022697 RepID=UPI00234178CD|nr:amidase domain-containing protein [Aneurinibacillus sp. Ricciae_BoGa-3]WCK55373.1 amidase domain-containing protein [Aneurinibacillus sp. Ricciae_BoGa-3]
MTTYNRVEAVRYADLWWNDTNPGFLRFPDDCTNYVSQCLYAGGIAMIHTGDRGSGWWYQATGTDADTWSYSWAVAHSFRWMLEGGEVISAQRKADASALTIGDVICYDFDGDGNWDHTTIVVAKDANGMPLVNAHTIDSRHREWGYKDSSEYTENTQYLFFHLLG